MEKPSGSTDEATSADIVDATGLGRGSLYAAYTSKNGLFDRALLHYNKHSARMPSGCGCRGRRLRELLLGVIDEDLRGRKGGASPRTAPSSGGARPAVAGLVRRIPDHVRRHS
jgi:TetR/AcrR family transcriptional repressor of nem operon